MILNIPFIVDWKAIRLHKQKIVDKNIYLKQKRKPHICRIRGKVLVGNKKSNKYEEPYVRPYPITQVWPSGNVTI